MIKEFSIFLIANFLLPYLGNTVGINLLLRMTKTIEGSGEIDKKYQITSTKKNCLILSSKGPLCKKSTLLFEASFASIFVCHIFFAFAVLVASFFHKYSIFLESIRHGMKKMSMG